MDYGKKYADIVKELRLDAGRDLEAARTLNDLLQNHDPQEDCRRLEKTVKGKTAYVYGAGPSLKKDISEIKINGLGTEKSVVHIAADGAGKALLAEGITPQIHVTDLDGGLANVVAINKKGSVTVVHAHGDNIPLIKLAVPKLRDVIGTTQTKAFGMLHNFGGFTDGDRCVFLAERFKPGMIVLAGMDFGKRIGSFSGKYDSERKIKKLKIGKNLIEELARESETTILNLTNGGENILNVPRVSPGQLRALTGEHALGREKPLM